MIYFEDILDEERTEQLANYVAQELISKDCIVHRCNSVTTSSIYLKADYGLAGSIRIADHKGKKNLNYRFNLLSKQGGTHVECIEGKVCDRHYYCYGSVDAMIYDILKFKSYRVHKYGGLQQYIEIMSKEKLKTKGIDGFWSKAFEVEDKTPDRLIKWLKRNELTEEEMHSIVKEVSETNIKFRNILNLSKYGWKSLQNNYLDLVLKRYNERSEID